MNVLRCGEEFHKELLTPVRRWVAHRDAVFDICWSDVRTGNFFFGFGFFYKGGGKKMQDDRSILSGSGDYQCCLWDTEKSALIGTYNGHSGSVKAVKFRDENIFASAGRDGHILIWDVRVASDANKFGMNVKRPVCELRSAHTLRKNSGGKRTPGRTPGGSSSSSSGNKQVCEFAVRAWFRNTQYRFSCRGWKWFGRWRAWRGS